MEVRVKDSWCIGTLNCLSTFKLFKIICLLFNIYHCRTYSCEYINPSWDYARPWQRPEIIQPLSTPTGEVRIMSLKRSDWSSFKHLHVHTRLRTLRNIWNILFIINCLYFSTKIAFSYIFGKQCCSLLFKWISCPRAYNENNYNHFVLTSSHPMVESAWWPVFTVKCALHQNIIRIFA